MRNLKQLALNLCLKDAASFANFLPGENKQLVTALNGLHINVTTPFIYLWGKFGSGKSHLLAAICQLFGEHNLSAAYLPLEDSKELNLHMLDDLEALDLLCIDDLHLIAGSLAWEEKIFHCYNNLILHKKKIVITASVSPQALPLKLLDLKSRMASGLVFAIQELSDEEKITSLKLRAKLRGLDLSDQVARFLLSHYERDTKSLFAVLDKLDKAALVAKRRLTIAFVKTVLGLSE
jgi:DnaA-homolog protein